MRTTPYICRYRKVRHFWAPALLGLYFGFVPACVSAQSGPDPIFEKPAPISMAEFKKLKFEGVRAIEVNDYMYPGYKGDIKPGAPHADLNPKKAIIIAWGDKTHQLVFCHEASYCPLLMLPNGGGLCNQFFEALGGELFCAPGRRERNSFVDVIESGPKRVWVRWNYFCVPTKETPPVLRGTEDYIAYPNGMIWRRLTFQSLKPDDWLAYSICPIDFYCTIPPGVEWETLVQKDAEHGDGHVAAVLDAASDKRYDLFWGTPEPGVIRGFGYGMDKVRRNGDNTVLQQIARSKLGFAMVMPFKGEMPFIILGDASGFDREKSQLVDNTHNDTGGWGWGISEWDHWPIGWLNSMGSFRKPDSPYPYCICQMSHYILDPPISKGSDYITRSKDMEANRWAERHVYYTLSGVGTDFEEIRKLSKKWLQKGKACATPESVADLKP